MQARPSRTYSNPLKALFENQRRRRQVSRRLVETEIGLTRFTLREWLSKPDSMFMVENLARLTDWIRQELPTFSLEQAVQLQGGTGEERRNNHADVAHAAHLEKLQKNQKYRRAYARSMAAALSGRSMPEEARQKISDAVRQYRARPDAHPFHGLRHTARGRARSIRVALKRHHPELTDNEVEARAVERLQQPPYEFSRDMARGFFRPLPSLTRKSGRRRDDERCTAFQQLAAEVAWDGLGRVPHGFYVALADRFGGEATPNTAREWHVRDFPTCRSCLLALANVTEKPQEMTDFGRAV